METERGFILPSSNINITQEENPTPTVKVDINGKLVNVKRSNIKSYSRNLVSVDEQVQVNTDIMTPYQQTSIVMQYFRLRR